MACKFNNSGPLSLIHIYIVFVFRIVRLLLSYGKSYLVLALSCAICEYAVLHLSPPSKCHGLTGGKESASFHRLRHPECIRCSKNGFIFQSRSCKCTFNLFARGASVAEVVFQFESPNQQQVIGVMLAYILYLMQFSYGFLSPLHRVHPLEICANSSGYIGALCTSFICSG